MQYIAPYSGCAIAEQPLPEPRVAVGPQDVVEVDRERAARYGADVAVLGEGEETTWELFATLSDGNGAKGLFGSMAAIPGLAYRDAGSKVVQTAPRAPILDLESLPWPAYDLVDMEAYFSQLHTHLSPQQARARYAPVFSSRGCPYRCIYCQHMFGRQIRYRSPEAVLAQVRHLVETYGVREIHFEDDSFNVDLDRAKRIFDLLAASGLNLRIAFPNGVRGDRVDEELIAKGKAAGLYSIAFGIESASPRILAMIHKSLSMDQVRAAIDLEFVAGFHRCPQVAEMHGVEGSPEDTDSTPAARFFKRAHAALHRGPPRTDRRETRAAYN
mgnify:CR=1 FL=1